MVEVMNKEGRENSKMQFFQRLLPLINTAIGKEMDRVEEGAIAFVVERNQDSSIEPDRFLREDLGVDNTKGREAALRIHTKVYEEKLIRLRELMVENREGQEAYKAWVDQLEGNYNVVREMFKKNPSYMPYIGGVALEWEPEWFRKWFR